MPKKEKVHFSGERAVAMWALHSPKSLEHICSMSPSALCSISHWAQILVTEERSRGGVRGIFEIKDNLEVCFCYRARPELIRYGGRGQELARACVGFLKVDHHYARRILERF